VSDAAECQRFVTKAIDRFGRIDIIVNNAAVTTDPFVQRIEDSDPGEVRRVMETNYEGAFNICRIALPYMIAAGRGVVVNIASMNAVLSPAGTAAYNASKAALVALTRTLAVEGVDHGVRANAIILGGTRTEMASKAIISRYEKRHNRRLTDADEIEQLLAHLADPAEVARAVALLCQDDAAPITGSEISINAAMTAGRALTLAAARARA
jgi:meso-butanediol dehydrogenase/(S,S)-butanediol dehydrogenase/diacetyl reductase